MTKKAYKVTIHEHIIYDYIVHSVSEEDAREIAENTVIDDDRTKWEQDYNAGWVDVSDVEEIDDIMEDDNA